MNLKQIIKLCCKTLLIKDDDTDSIEILKADINEAYEDISQFDKRINIVTLKTIKNKATLPEDINKIESISPELEDDEKIIGNTIITNSDKTFILTYSYVKEPLIYDTDEPELNTKYHYAIYLKACALFLAHKGNVELSNYYNAFYERRREELESADYGDCFVECVKRVDQ